MKKNIWLLLDNRIGSRHQAEGIASFLDTTKFNIITKEIEYTKWASLPNIIRGKTLLGLTKECKQRLIAPFPDLVISATRRTAPVARWIKKQSNTTKLIQLLHIGRIGIKDFSLIFAPEHDKHKGTADNIHFTIGSPHAITTEKLEKAQKEWAETFKNLPHPITAVVIGGSIKKRLFTLTHAEQLANQIKQLKDTEGGSLLITTSRRTGLDAENKIISHLKDIPNYLYLWGNKGKNPYLGFLSCADNLIVTGDSVSMCCEATATKKPLRIFTGDWLTKKHLRFVNSLCANGYATYLNAMEQNTEQKTNNLNVAKEIADIIAKL